MVFTIRHKDKDSNARTGVIHTDHGEIQTPIFMPVGTRGTVKSIRKSDLEEIIEAEIILGNTYHLYLRPGTEVIQKSGGLHQFVGWNKPMLTDSGGYQVYSLSNTSKIKEEGTIFTSHIDGSKHLFSPENVIEIQQKIGADIIMVFDECTSYPIDERYAKKAMERTHRWLDRCIKKKESSRGVYDYNQIMAPIVQGSTYPNLRKISAEEVASRDLPINAIGGLSVGEPHHLMYEMTAICCEILPKEKPRYLMGVGTPVNLLESIALGIDMFDCVLPTRNARHGILYTWEGEINIKNAKWRDDTSAIDERSKSPLSRNHSKAFLRHLIQNHEMLGAQIASMHNLCFYLELMQAARKHIEIGDFGTWKNSIIPKLTIRL